MNKHGFVDNERTGQSFYYKNYLIYEDQHKSCLESGKINSAQ